MKETAVNKLPKPEDTDAPDGPTQIGLLADTLDVLKWGSRNLKPTAGIVYGTGGSVFMLTSMTDVPGAVLEITPAVESKLLVTAVFDFATGATNKCEGTVRLAATDQTPRAVMEDAVSSGGRGTCAQNYVLTLPAATKSTIKLRCISGSTGAVITPQNCSMLYQMIAA